VCSSPYGWHIIICSAFKLRASPLTQHLSGYWVQSSVFQFISNSAVCDSNGFICSYDAVAVVANPCGVVDMSGFCGQKPLTLISYTQQDASTQD
jgi:hypothetical protein